MGLFSKKPQAPNYDQEDCIVKKQRMREIFNETVEDGDSYEILYAYMTSSKFERGFIFDTNTTSFYYYIVGHRRSDFDVVLIQVDSQLGEHTDACPIEMDKVVNVSYEPKYHQLCFQYEKNYGISISRRRLRYSWILQRASGAGCSRRAVSWINGNVPVRDQAPRLEVL